MQTGTVLAKQNQIMARQRVDKDLRLFHPQKGADLLAVGLWSGGCEGGNHRPFLQGINKIRDLQVAGTERISPVQNTVGLVHHNQTRRGQGNRGPEYRRLQPLRRNVENAAPVFHWPCRSGCIPISNGLIGHWVVLGDVTGGDALGVQSGHLICHQRDSRFNHQGPGASLLPHRQSRNLKHDRFACAGWGYDQGVRSLLDAADRFHLMLAQRLDSQNIHGFSYAFAVLHIHTLLT